jgi:hypothetical protein
LVSSSKKWSKGDSYLSISSVQNISKSLRGIICGRPRKPGSLSAAFFASGVGIKYLKAFLHKGVANMVPPANKLRAASVFYFILNFVPLF